MHPWSGIITAFPQRFPMSVLLLVRWLPAFAAFAVAAADVVPPQPVPPPPIAAKSFLLVDVVSGQTLVAQSADEPREPASLTKSTSR